MSAIVQLLGGNALAEQIVAALAHHPRRPLYALGGEVEASRCSDGAQQRCHAGYALGAALDVVGRILPRTTALRRVRRLLLDREPAGLTGLVGVALDGARPRVKLYVARGQAAGSGDLRPLLAELADALSLQPPAPPPLGDVDVLALELPRSGEPELKAYLILTHLEDALPLVPAPARPRLGQLWRIRAGGGRAPILIPYRGGEPVAVQIRIAGDRLDQVPFAPTPPPGALPTYVSLRLGDGAVTTYFLLPGRPLAPVPAAPDSAPAPQIDEPRAIDVSIGEVCNNDCRFCINPTPSWAPLAERSRLEQTIRRCAEAGYRRLGFLGGEPTLHPHLPELIELAYASGFEEVMLITNGRRLKDPAYARRLRAAGIERCLFMLLSTRARVHDAITRTPGSLREALLGARAARAAGITVGANVPVTRANVDHLAETCVRLAEAGIRQLALLYLSAYGNVLTNPGILAPLELAAAQIRRAIEAVGDEATIVVDNFPYCYLPGLEAHIHSEMANPWREIAYPSGSIVDVSEIFRFRKKRLPQCDGCRWDRICGGVQDTDHLDAVAQEAALGLERARQLR